MSWDTTMRLGRWGSVVIGVVGLGVAIFNNNPFILVATSPVLLAWGFGWLAVSKRTARRNGWLP